MTPEILEYLLRATVIWAVLLAYYYVSGRRESFRFQRFFLLGGWLFGVVVPLLPALASGALVVGFPSVTYVAEPFYYGGETAAEMTSINWSWSTAIPWLYFSGVAFFLARTLVQWRGLRQWYSSGRKDYYDGCRVIRHRDITGPFAAFGCIFLPAEMSDAELETTALIHETSHLRARHHYDTLLLTISSIAFWFHPLFWLFRRLLATVHEYEADAVVIQRVPARVYGLQLLRSSLTQVGYPGLFSSPIKDRIEMITTKNEIQKPHRLNLFFLSFLLAGLVFTCSSLRGDTAAPSEESNAKEAIHTSPVAPLKKTLTEGLNPEESYQKGYEDAMADAEKALGKLVDELAKTVYKRITYPAIARSTGETGKFIFQIDVDETGLITNFAYLEDHDGKDLNGEVSVVGFGRAVESRRGSSDALIQEVLRTLDGLQLPEPLTVMGQPMPAKVSVQFNFLLEE